MLKRKSFLGYHARRSCRPLYRPRESAKRGPVSRDGQLRATVTAIAWHTGYPRLFGLGMHINDYYPFALVRHHHSKLFQASFLPLHRLLPHITITTGGARAKCTRARSSDDV